MYNLRRLSLIIVIKTKSTLFTLHTHTTKSEINLLYNLVMFDGGGYTIDLRKH